MGSGGVIGDTSLRIDEVVVGEVFLSRLHATGCTDGVAVKTEGEEVEEMDIRHVTSVLEEGIGTSVVDELGIMLIDLTGCTEEFVPTLCRSSVDVDLEVGVALGLVFSPLDRTGSGAFGRLEVSLQIILVRSIGINGTIQEERLGNRSVFYFVVLDARKIVDVSCVAVCESILLIEITFVLLEGDSLCAPFADVVRAGGKHRVDRRISIRKLAKHLGIPELQEISRKR